MSTTYEARRTVLSTIHDRLEELVMSPPRRTNDSYGTVDLSAIDKKLVEIRVFWDSYLKLTKIEEHRYNLTNLHHIEQNMYKSCKWWLDVLETMIRTKDMT